MTIHYHITPEVFARFPEFRRGVVIAHGIRNGPSPAGLVERLRRLEAALSAQFTPESIVAHPRINSWREAYRAIGIKPADFRPSVEALLRRVVKKDPLPLINTVVDLGNLASLAHLAPIGAHAIDVLAQDIALRLASGDETFAPFGSDVIEHPQPGEIIFAEGDTVLCRRWTWRQSQRTLVTPHTTAVEVNVDGLPPLTQAEVGEICQDVAGLLAEFCGGTITWGILCRETPVIQIG